MPERPLSKLQNLHRESGECLTSISGTFAPPVTSVEDTPTGAWIIRYQRPRSPAPWGDQGRPAATDQPNLEQE